MNDYQLGQQAFIRDEPLDPTRPFAWRKGFRDAQQAQYDQENYGRFDEVAKPLDFGVLEYVS